MSAEPSTGLIWGRRRDHVLQSDARCSWFPLTPITPAGWLTVLAVVLTSNTALALMPGNVFLPADATGLPRDSVVNVTGIVTLNKAELSEHIGAIPYALLQQVEIGLAAVFGLR